MVRAVGLVDGAAIAKLSVLCVSFACLIFAIIRSSGSVLGRAHEIRSIVAVSLICMALPFLVEGIGTPTHKEVFRAYAKNWFIEVLISTVLLFLSLSLPRCLNPAPQIRFILTPVTKCLITFLVYVIYSMLLQGLAYKVHLPFSHLAVGDLIHIALLAVFLNYVMLIIALAVGMIRLSRK